MIKLYAPLILLLLSACRENSKPVVNPADYQSILQNNGDPGAGRIRQLDTEISFWESRNPVEDVADLARISALRNERFRYSADVADLGSAQEKAESLRKLTGTNQSDVYRTLARLAIQKHEFERARQLLDTALLIGDQQFKTYAMLFDVGIELGDRFLAEQSLKKISSENDFETLIRKSRWEDQVNGDLDKAIEFMEEAADGVKRDGDTTLYLWARTNLGDMYGHAGRYHDSYQSFLESLQLDPGNYHSLRGIAWLAYSHDRNAAEAEKILRYLAHVHPSPENFYGLSQLAAYQNNQTASQGFLNLFLDAIQDSRYGNMYHAVVFDIMVERKEYDRALQLANAEVNARPSAGSYAMLAQIYSLVNNKTEAKRLLDEEVAARSFEPRVLHRVGLSFFYLGDHEKAEAYLQSAAEAGYELGPVIADEIELMLGKINKT